MAAAICITFSVASQARAFGEEAFPFHTAHVMACHQYALRMLMPFAPEISHILKQMASFKYSIKQSCGLQQNLMLVFELHSHKKSAGVSKWPVHYCSGGFGHFHTQYLLFVNIHHSPYGMAGHHGRQASHGPEACME